MLFVFFRERINLRDGAKVELFGLLNFEEKHLKMNQKLNTKSHSQFGSSDFLQ